MKVLEGNQFLVIVYKDSMETIVKTKDIQKVFCVRREVEGVYHVVRPENAKTFLWKLKAAWHVLMGR